MAVNPMMAVNNPLPTSPQVWRFPDYKDRAITFTVTFNNKTRAITGVTAVRDPGCLYQTLYWDLGPDGTPNSSAKQVTIPEGTTNIGRGQLSGFGINTVEDIYDVNFTVGP